MIEKLRENDVSKSMIVNNQSFGDASAGNNMVSNDAYDWTLQIDLRSATNLSSKQDELALPSPFVEVSWSPDLRYERSGDVR